MSAPGQGWRGRAIARRGLANTCGPATSTPKTSLTIWRERRHIDEMCYKRRACFASCLRVCFWF